MLRSLASPLPPLARLCGHLVVALVALVVIGGATRVMEAGLACPDWPLCYGQLLPGGRMNLQVFLEWFHRLDAFVVGMALLLLCGVSLLERARLPRWQPIAAIAALLLVALQGGLGALTVTRLLAAPLVTAHLATALLLVALLSGLHQALRVMAVVQGAAPAPAPAAGPGPALPRWWIALVMLALALVFAQCLLGGSLASQWAAQRCLQDGDACIWLGRHRGWARPAAVAVLLVFTAVFRLPRPFVGLRWQAALAAVLVVLQIALGLVTFRLQLSQPAVTIAHQLTAALLVAVLAGLAGRSLALRSATAALPMSSGSSMSDPPLEVARG
jgi:cytochrome c oxidase assembly protein subunit 15